MIAFFNGRCALCGQLRPRCARVYLKLTVGQASRYRRTPRILCGICRAARNGRYRLDARHKRGNHA